MVESRIGRIRGGAGPYEAAALAAVVQHLLETEEKERSQVPERPVPAAWVRTAMPTPFARYVPPVRPEPSGGSGS